MADVLAHRVFEPFGEPLDAAYMDSPSGQSSSQQLYWSHRLTLATRDLTGCFSGCLGHRSSGYMVYRSILVRMQACLLDVEDLVKSEAFAASRSFASWQRFYDCGQIRVKAELPALLDMSRSILLFSANVRLWIGGQATAWIATYFQVSENFQRSNIAASWTDRSCAALISRDYLAHRPIIFAQDISQRNQNPLPVVHFNYMKGCVVVDVIPWPNYRDLLIIASRTTGSFAIAATAFVPPRAQAESLCI
ncbi:hypothetical protein DFH09DRAFT_1301135 [Mycena vulgaris]|nr:hypothetical protein DFH09DRAFT_1301135 [Mycena vulgaris]